MISNFLVGATFKILDEASPALRSILAQVRALNVQLRQGARVFDDARQVCRAGRSGNRGCTN